MSSYYNPKTSNQEGYDELAHSVSRAANQGNPHLIIGGDFNLPGWDWKAKIVKSNTTYPTIHHKFGEMLDDHGLVQVVEEPTRGTNILDLIVTNYPSRLNRTDVIPGHDVVFTEVEVKPRTNKQRQGATSPGTRVE